MKGNIEAVELDLTEVGVEEIETGCDFDIGFPYDFLGERLPKDQSL